MDIYTAISQLGFPIFVAVWLLIRSDKKEEATKDAIIKNTVAIEKLIEIIPSMKQSRKR